MVWLQMKAMRADSPGATGSRSPRPSDRSVQEIIEKADPLAFAPQEMNPKALKCTTLAAATAGR
jgi:hypothetical protein